MVPRLLTFLAAVGLLAYCAGLVFYGGAFPGPGHVADRDAVLLFVAATVGAGVLHLLACAACHRRPPRLWSILVVGFAARLILLFGAPGPILEGDPNRIRFDARLVNQGMHPFEFQPSLLMDEDPRDVLLTGPQLERLVRARAALTSSTDVPRPDSLRRPDLRTHATPLSLWIGSIADRFKPGSTRGFAFLALVADTLTIFLLILALRAAGRPIGWLMAYAWCPVLLKEFYCTLAPEAFLMPALAGLLWCIATNRRMLAAVPLAICGGLRPALLLLVPFFGRRIGLLGIMLAAALFLIPFLPFQHSQVPAEAYVEGHLHIWRHYEYNSLADNLLRTALGPLDWQAENTLTVAGVTVIQPGEPLSGLLARILGLAVILGLVTYLVIRLGAGMQAAWKDAEGGFTDLFTVLAALLLFSPVVHPWLVLWLLPVLAVRPAGIAWLALPVLVSLSYLTHLEGPDAADLTLLGATWSFRIIEYGIFGILLVLDLMMGGRHLRPPEEPLARRLGTEEDMPFELAPFEDHEPAPVL